MASDTRTSSEPLDSLAAMAAEPWEHDFFQALRRIQSEARDLPRIGHSVRLADDPLRLGQTQDVAFAPSTLSAVEPGNEHRPPRLEQYFFGLGGPNGPLPLHLTEYVRERQRNHADSTSKAFFDVFHHRLLSLFYRAWAEARPSVALDRADDDHWSPRLAALSGRGSPALLGQGPLEDSAKLHFSGHLAAQTRYPDGLRAILSDYFGVPVSIEEYIGQWLPLPDQSRAGVYASTLGVDVCLGSHVWDRQHKFRIRVGPLNLERYMALLPDGEAFPELAAWVAEYQGEELDWDLNLTLAQKHVPPLALKGAARLGFNTWLGAPAKDPDDLLLARDYANKPHAPLPPDKETRA